MLIKYPVKDREISQPFGFDNTNHPIRKDFYSLFDNKHPGVDFPVPPNTEVFASFSGVIVRKEFHQGMGNVIGIRKGNIVALYAHLNTMNVDLGDFVEDTQLIALSGATGSACPDPHLHFELRDVSKNSLKEMVFEPKFEKECMHYKETFEYIVNNTNTQKTLGTLAQLYFGDSSKWNLINDFNNLNLEKDDLLDSGLEVGIPNCNY